MKNRWKGTSYLVSTVILFALHVNAIGQKQRVFLDFNQYTAKAGETIYFKGYIIEKSNLSMHPGALYVNLCSKSGKKVFQQVFTIDSGQCVGQVSFPDTLESDNYYVVAFTPYSLAYTVPIAIHNKEKPNTFFRKQFIQDDNSITSATINGITWISYLSAGSLVSLVKSDTLAHPRHLILQRPDKNDHGFVTDIILEAQSAPKYTTFPIDTTKDVQTLLLYEDSTLIGRQYLKTSNSADNIQIKMDVFEVGPTGHNSWTILMPDSSCYYASISVEDADRSLYSPNTITSLQNSYTEDLYSKSSTTIDSNLFISTWKDDADIVNVLDTSSVENELKLYRHADALRPVLIKGRKDIRKELDSKYTTGSFAESASLSFDMSDSVYSQEKDLFTLLNLHSGRLKYDPLKDSLKDVFSHPIHYFINEVECNAYSLRMFDLSSIAYIKILESNFLPVSKGMTTLDDKRGHACLSKTSPANSMNATLNLPNDLTPVNVLIYSRHLETQTFASTASSGQFEEPIPFVPNYRMLLWHPLEKVKNSVQIQFDDAPHCRRLRLKVSAINAVGRIAYIETIISNPDFATVQKYYDEKNQTASKSLVTSATDRADDSDASALK